MRHFVIAAGISCFGSVAACDVSAGDPVGDDALSSVTPGDHAQTPLAEETGANERYVHATIAMTSPFQLEDWCVNVSLVSKSRIQALGIFCASEFESGDNELLANLRCEPGKTETLVVSVEGLAPPNLPEWKSGCSELGCRQTVECRDTVNETHVAVPLTLR